MECELRILGDHDLRLDRPGLDPQAEGGAVVLVEQTIGPDLGGGNVGSLDSHHALFRLGGDFNALAMRNDQPTALVENLDRVNPEDVSLIVHSGDVESVGR